MSDGPNYEALFQGMKCLHGGSAEDVKVIVRYLRFYQGQEQFDMYANHYLPMLPEEVAAEFKPKEKHKVKVEEETITDTVSIPAPAPKKRGRPSSK